MQGKGRGRGAPPATATVRNLEVTSRSLSWVGKLVHFHQDVTGGVFGGSCSCYRNSEEI